jgi:predicted molibdopterin-dependent oxidoreductase YjgC
MASVMPIYGGISHKRIKKFGIQWPCPDKRHPGTPFLHKDRFTRGKGLFHTVDFIPAAELPDDEYPYVLTTGRILYHFHTGTMSRRVDGLDEVRPDGFVEINPADAKTLGIKNGDYAEVASRRGTVTARCVVTDRSRPNAVFMAFHFHEAAANILTNDALDPIAKIPEFKVCAVNITKVGKQARKKALKGA